MTGRDVDILEVDAIDRHFGQSVELHRKACMIAVDVANVDIAEDGSLLCYRHSDNLFIVVAVSQSLSHRLPTIIHIKGKGIGSNVAHRDTINIDILHDAAASTSGLEAQPYIGTHKLTIANRDIPHATTHF